jgi:transaldolase
MSIYLDSAELPKIERLLLECPFVAEVTTNPLLLKKSGLGEIELLRALRVSTSKPVFAQVTLGPLESMRRHAYELFKAAGEGVVLKIPFCTDGLKLVRDLSSSFRTCVTAVANPTQGYAAATLGARWVAVYVGRIEESRGADAGLATVRALSTVLAARGERTRILAASVRKAEWIAELLALPNVDVTLTPDMLEGALTDAVTTHALAEFRHLAKKEHP